MLAGLGVDAAVTEPQTLDRAVTYDVRPDDLGDVGHVYVSIPNALGIDHHGRTVLALVEASGFVGANGVFEPTKSELGFEGPLKFGGAVGITASAGMSLGTPVAAYENVFFEFRHGIRVGGDKNGPHAAARRRLKPELERRLDLEAPSFQKWFGDVLRVLVLARPLTQAGRTNVLIGLKLKFLYDLFEFGDGGDHRADRLGLTPVWIAASLCHV